MKFTIKVVAVSGGTLIENVNLPGNRMTPVGEVLEKAGVSVRDKEIHVNGFVVSEKTTVVDGATIVLTKKTSVI